MPQPDIEWDVFQSYGRMPANLDRGLAVPANTWVAAAIHSATGNTLAQSDPQPTEAAARADGERKLAAWQQKQAA
ncbi:hypothetical protein SGFS_013090 [Streptomyces graminofaciens]|uniref:Uncharacterized protein n=1 Tax=Streptomyces graminofaciens TaxID=68212 RepID=A0ABN5VAT5_9ACTN|nr:hypothetical protein [Streptomyces graminofaciens]BBC30015.1 hypothetical protein SGFS_013090 [Streptomyces graminofaciens]